ncbi:MAG: hypothetical protein ED559_11415 [Phycisphaera sp.]|nr:MAG: hypothetical protein ED559_11415 [Phycisphaera sp.]
MKVKRLTVMAVIMIAIGLIVIVASGGGMWWSWTNIMAAGHGVTVPASIDLNVDPTREHAVWRELAGPHITENRPLLDPPEDLLVVITNRRTGETIETRELVWMVRQSLMPGFEKSRRAILAFDPPEHGEISVEVSGSFAHDQVYRVAPSVRAWVTTVLPATQYGAGAGLLLMFLGIAVLIGKALKNERRALQSLEG